MKNEQRVEIVASSVSNETGVKIVTMALRYHRFIHAELMTHRVFSRNASSSRAIPVLKMLKQVWSDPATPYHWGSNQPGMQAGKELPGWKKALLRFGWRSAAKGSAAIAYVFYLFGLHKQVANRVTEPFQFIQVVVTSTEWENWYNLRAHGAAQPEIQHLAYLMQDKSKDHLVRHLMPGQWHTPYFGEGYWSPIGQQEVDIKGFSLAQALAISTARCARVSYQNHDGSTSTLESDVKLHNALADAGHFSPFEHCATPMRGGVETFTQTAATHLDNMGNFWSGNFRRWTQYRQIMWAYADELQAFST